MPSECCFLEWEKLCSIYADARKLTFLLCRGLVIQEESLLQILRKHRPFTFFGIKSLWSYRLALQSASFKAPTSEIFSPTGLPRDNQGSLH